MTVATLRALVLGIIAWALTSCVPTSTVGRIQQEVQSHLPGLSGTSADSTTQAAIQLVIERGNFEQEEAIADHNTSAMRDTATPNYYQDSVQSNSDLLSQGVTGIKLIGLQWGPITVNGNSATATTQETWSTTFADGSTEQDTDRNVYTLTQQNGNWLINSDDHPEAGSAQSSPGPGSGTPSTNATPTPGTFGTPQPTPTSGPTATPDQQSAIQGVIQRANQEQVQALSSGDPTVMQDTATDSYYQTMAQTNQGLQSESVASIALNSLQWGPITVSGATATATTYEDWTTTLANGQSSSSTDRNVYTLLQQSDGSWKINEDDQPDNQNNAPLPGRGIQV